MGLNKKCLESPRIWQCWTSNIGTELVGEGDQSQVTSPVLDSKPSPHSQGTVQDGWALSNGKFNF